MQRMENAAAIDDDGSNGVLHSPRHQTKSQTPRRDEGGHENGVGAHAVVMVDDGEIDDCSQPPGETKHQLELRPQASWTFSSASPPKAPKDDLRRSRSSTLSTSHEGQVFMDEAKKFILFYAESAITIKDLENNTQDTYQLGLPDGERLFWAEVSADLKHLLVRTMSRPQWIKIYSLEGGKAQERFLVQGGKRVGSIERVHWTEPGNLFIVSPGGIEFYQIPNRDSLSLMEKWTLRDTDLRLLKEFKMPVQFSKYYASTRVLLAYTGVKGGKAKLEGFFFKQDFVMKLPKFEIDMVADSVLTADNISMCRLYERLFCAHIEETQITLYQITKTSLSKKATILLEGRPLPHRLRIHCVDNLLALHNTDAKTTTLYDIRHAQFSADDTIVQPIAEGLSIAPFSYEDKVVSLYQKRWQYLQPNYVLDQDEEKLFEVGLELPHLVDCFPDKERLVQFLLRRTHSRTLTLEIVRNALQQRVPLPVVSKIFDSINVVFDVPPAPAEKSSNRSMASSLPITRTMTVSPAGKALPPVSVIPSGSSLMQNGSVSASSPISYRSDSARFEGSSFASSSPLSFAPDSPSTFWSPITTTTSVYSSPYSSSSSMSPSFASTSSSAASQSPFPLADTSVLASPFSAWDIMIEEEKRARGGQLMLDQNDLYNHVFVPLDDNKLVGSDYFIPVLTEYVRSLSFYKQNVEHFVCKLIIEHLITSNRYYQLHQFLQYHVIGDSVHVACQLLSVEKNYPPAYQLALDMLKRLSATRKGVKDQIVEVLLTRHQLLPALRLIRNAEISVSTHAAERFLEVALEQDENLFYTVYKFFEKRGEINRECAPFIQTFCKMFPGPDSALWESTAGLEAHHYSGPAVSSQGESDDSAPSSSSSLLTTFADLSSSPYASPAPSSPFSKRRGNTGGKKPAARSALAL